MITKCVMVMAILAVGVVVFLGCGPEHKKSAIPFCGSLHQDLPPGQMTDRQWTCVNKGEPLNVIRALYQGIKVTDDGVIWKSGDGHRVYLATLACSYHDDVGDCVGSQVVKEKRIYTR